MIALRVKIRSVRTASRVSAFAAGTERGERTITAGSLVWGVSELRPALRSNASSSATVSRTRPAIERRSKRARARGDEGSRDTAAG